jgi:hypothetical protein
VDESLEKKERTSSINEDSDDDIEDELALVESERLGGNRCSWPYIPAAELLRPFRVLIEGIDQVRIRSRYSRSASR